MSKDSILANSQYAPVFSADLVSFLLPSRFNPLYDSYVIHIYELFLTHFTEWESYLGIVAVLLALIAVFKVGFRATGLWLAALLVFAILSLGPHLQILGKEFEDARMPFYWLQELPAFDAIRSPKRFLVTAMLALAVLSGYGSHYLFSKKPIAWRLGPYLVMFALVGLVLTDYWGWPRTLVTSDATVPQFFSGLKADPRDIALLHIPLPNLADPKPLYYQTVHGKKLIGGYVERPTPEASEFLNENRFLRNASLPGIENKTSITKAEEMDADRLFLALPEIEYVVLGKRHFFYPRLRSFDVYGKWLRDKFGDPIYEDELIAVYPVSRQ